MASLVGFLHFALLSIHVAGEDELSVVGSDHTLAVHRSRFQVKGEAVVDLVDLGLAEEPVQAALLGGQERPVHVGSNRFTQILVLGHAPFRGLAPLMMGGGSVEDPLPGRRTSAHPCRAWRRFCKGYAIPRLWTIC